jgi:hypothetical protein
VCEVVIAGDIDLTYGFLEIVTDAFLGLGSRGGGDGPLALIAKLSKSSKRKLQKLKLYIPPGAWSSVSFQC